MFGFGWGSGWSLFCSLPWLLCLSQLSFFNSHLKSFALHPLFHAEKRCHIGHVITLVSISQTSEYMQTSNKIQTYWVSTYIIFQKLPICFGICYEQKGKIYQMNDWLVQLCIDLFLPAYKARSGFVCPLGIRALDAYIYIYICLGSFFWEKQNPLPPPQ